MVTRIGWKRNRKIYLQETTTTTTNETFPPSKRKKLSRDIDDSTSLDLDISELEDTFIDRVIKEGKKEKEKEKEKKIIIQIDESLESKSSESKSSESFILNNDDLNDSDNSDNLNDYYSLWRVDPCPKPKSSPGYWYPEMNPSQRTMGTSEWKSHIWKWCDITI